MTKWIPFWLMFLFGAFLVLSNVSLQVLDMLLLSISLGLLLTGLAAFFMAIRKGASGFFDKWFSFGVAYAAVIGALAINIFGVG